MDELHGCVAVVTGAASGIGLALSERFAREGMHVVMSDVDPSRLDEVAATIEGDVASVAADVSRREDVEALAASAIERFGAVHVLCNNAGVTRPGRAWEFTREQWEWVLGVNLWGVVHGVNAFVPGMIERGEPGHIVNTASLSGLLAWPGLSLYAAGKYAVVGFSESLELDLRAAGAQIGVSVLCPGPTRTNFRASSRELEPDAPGDPVPDVEIEVEWQTPAAVADKVVDAIRSGRFWILTHPAYNEAIERRTREAVTTGDLTESAFV
jgi:NAD(P)-dependent dehydrogenase (short-subunit alcohol dehydrogenase family)